MTTATIRARLSEYIRFADDKKVQAIYNLVENEIIEELDLWEDEAFLEELERRIDSLESGEEKGISWDDVKAKANKIVKS